MQKDFHYYATYCAAFIAGFSHDESLQICYCAQLVDVCSRTFLQGIKGPDEAATTQLQLELMEARTDLIGLQDITRIWSSFHFLPYDLYAEKKKCSKVYLQKYRLICGPNGALVSKTVELAKDRGPEAAGIAMHVLADTWAHRYFAGTPSLVINNTNYHFYEHMDSGERRKISFRHSRSVPDDTENSIYTNSIYQGSENSVMNLGHGRAGHLPDYSYIHYSYLPAWANYEEYEKDNPTEYMKAFTQMIHALKYLRSDCPAFLLDHYDTEAIAEYRGLIDEILRKRQMDACEDWKCFGEKLSGQTIPDFDSEVYKKEYLEAKEGLLDKFIHAAMRQKSMVTEEIHRSGSFLAGRIKK
ncbi:MAG: hypothetical protein K6E16_00780 [Lachnospiraceae bacterium]|nr:hypothetical protein [Lachnospiraceae bacterium]